MVSLTIKHSVKWRAPVPIWTENSSTGIRTRNELESTYPSILRFANDNFMQELLDVMDDDPGRIAEWLAQPETWREPMATPKVVKKAEASDGLSYLLNRTKQQTDAIKPSAGKALAKPRQAATVADAARRRNLPVKLFHSSHQRFYLISASLVTSDPGFPDQALDLGKREKASFVLRRLVPPEGTGKIAEGEEIDLTGWDEYAFISTTSGHRWVRLDETGRPACRRLWPQEEQLPLFPVNYRDGCNHVRTVFNGLIPVGKREKWMGAPLGDTALLTSFDGGGSTPLASVSHARKLFQTDVAEPWKILLEQADTAKQSIAVSFEEFDGGDSSDENKRTRRTLRDNIQMASWYVLLDFASFLERFLPDLWDYVNGVDGASAPTGDTLQLYRIIRDTRLPNSVIEDLVEFDDRYLTSTSIVRADRREAAVSRGGVETSLLDAIVRIGSHRDDLEAVENEFVRYHDLTQLPTGAEAFAVDSKWPDFLFPLADPRYNGPYPDRAGDSEGLDTRLGKIDALAELIEKILPEPSLMEDVIPPPGALDQRDAWFTIRCVYQRPHCGPLFPALVSDSSRVFQMAPFFDPDAPARPIRIPMPVDVSPAGLRKFQKNTAFVISDMLCGKIKKIRKITFGDLVLSVLPWPFHKDLPNPGETGPCGKDTGGFGMICSLSIPIVTLCALILLMIMVALFDLFFRWIPFLFLCLPIPGLKGKT